MNIINVYTIDDLLEDIKNIGYPVIQFYSSSLLMKALPDYHHMHEYTISFWVEVSKGKAHQKVAELSKSVVMQTTQSPSNEDVECRKCILIKNATTGVDEGNLFWPVCLYGESQ